MTTTKLPRAELLAELHHLIEGMVDRWDDQDACDDFGTQLEGVLAKAGVEATIFEAGWLDGSVVPYVVAMSAAIDDEDESEFCAQLQTLIASMLDVQAYDGPILEDTLSALASKPLTAQELKILAHAAVTGEPVSWPYLRQPPGSPLSPADQRGFLSYGPGRLVPPIRARLENLERPTSASAPLGGTSRPGPQPSRCSTPLTYEKTPPWVGRRWNQCRLRELLVQLSQQFVQFLGLVAVEAR